MRYIFYTLLIVNLAFFGFEEVMKGSPPSPLHVATPDKTNAILLLSETSSAANSSQLDTVVSNPVSTKPAASGNCLAIGPFEDMFSAQALVRQLQALDIDTQLKAFDQATGQNDYRVLIPPADSLQDAFRKLRELKSRKIDSYVITQGQYALGISLGVFSNQDTASKVRAEREKEGYDVEVAAIPRQTREFWIFSAKGKDIAVSPQLWQSLVSEHGGLGRKMMPCPAPADSAAAPAASAP